MVVNDAPDPEAPVAESRIGEYRLLDRIAVGGMAEVFLAEEPRPVGEPRTVVLKRMLPHVAESREGKEAFMEEARLVQRVRHPNVVSLLGVGEAGPHPHLLLEYVPGCDLHRLARFLRRQGEKLPRRMAMFIATEMLAGLEAVHSAKAEDGAPLGIIHRDVTPSNVLLSVHGEVKLGDLGIAHARAARHESQVAPKPKNRGKIGYLSPEQVVGATIDRRSDLFSAGVVAAELLIGKPLFGGGSEIAVLLAIRDGRLDRFDAVAHDLPDGLARALREALSPEPDDRLESASALREALLPFGPRDPERARRALGELVKLARKRDGASVGRSSLPAPGKGGEESRRGVPGATGDSGPPTLEMDESRYAVRERGGKRLGEYAFAELVEAIATGEVGMHDLVRTPDGAELPLSEIKRLARHLPPSSFTPITRETPETLPPDRRHGMADGGIVRALAVAAMHRSTGLLLCEGTSQRKEVYIESGTPTLVASNRASELLGEYLVSEGILEREQLEVALDRMPRFEGRLGDTLVALGIVDPVDLFQHIETHGRERILDLFSWTEGVASFYRGVPSPPSGFRLKLEPWELLQWGIHRRIAAGLEEETFRTRMLDTLEVSSEAGRWASLPGTPPAFRTILARARRSMPLAELATPVEDTLGDDGQGGYRTVVLLLHLGALRWAD